MLSEFGCWFGKEKGCGSLFHSLIPLRKQRAFDTVSTRMILFHLKVVLKSCTVQLVVPTRGRETINLITSKVLCLLFLVVLLPHLCRIALCGTLVLLSGLYPQYQSDYGAPWCWLGVRWKPMNWSNGMLRTWSISEDKILAHMKHLANGEKVSASA